MNSPAPLFGKTRALIGMIHLAALPGTPGHHLPVSRIVAQARDEALLYAEAGVDAILIENMHDRPYLKGQVGPEITAAMTAAASAVRSAFSGPCGVQVLAGANEAALAVALAADFQFIRAEGFVFAHVADEGIIESCAGQLLRLRRAWGAEKIQVFADIKKKHSSHAITADVSLADTAHAAEFFGVDGVVVTGLATGDPVSSGDLDQTLSATRLPILVGSGTSLENLDEMLARASAVIVGSWLKKDGDWRNPPDPSRVRQLVERTRSFRP